MGEANFLPGRVEKGEFKMPFFSFLKDLQTNIARNLVVTDKPDGEYYLFLRERQLKFQRESEVPAHDNASLFYPISSQCIGDSWRVFWKNENGLVLHNLPDRPQEIEQVPYRMVLQLEKAAILFSKEEVLVD